jgi:hypothetical protein
LADALVADVVDGLVGPFRRRGREWEGVAVIRGGVEGEKDEAFVVVAVDLELAHVEELGVAAPTPDDGDLVAADAGFNVRLDGGEVGRGLVRAFDAERFADRITE